MDGMTWIAGPHVLLKLVPRVDCHSAVTESHGAGGSSPPRSTIIPNQNQLFMIAVSAPFTARVLCKAFCAGRREPKRLF